MISTIEREEDFIVRCHNDEKHKTIKVKDFHQLEIFSGEILIVDTEKVNNDNMKDYSLLCRYGKMAVYKYNKNEEI